MLSFVTQKISIVYTVSAVLLLFVYLKTKVLRNCAEYIIVKIKDIKDRTKIK